MTEQLSTHRRMLAKYKKQVAFFFLLEKGQHSEMKGIRIPYVEN